MSIPPLRRFLGLGPSPDARALLDLPAGPLTAVQIQAALTLRLSVVDEHPDHGSIGAIQVRLRLREAARDLQAKAGPATGRPTAAPAPLTRSGPPIRPGSPQARSIPVPPTLRPPGEAAAGVGRPPVRLTAFDQQVMAVLVSCRGWNAAARSKLVAVAAAHGVSVQGLMKVVTGLSEYAKAGGPRLAVHDITAGRSRMANLPMAPMADPAQTSAMLKMVGKQFDDQRPFTRLKLSAIFGVITLLAAALLTKLLLPPTAPVTPPVATVTEPAPMTPSRVVPPTVPSSGTAPLAFTRMPTFVGNALPMAATEAADESRRLPEMLDRLARKLTISPEAAIADYKNWEQSLQTIATGWVLVDSSTRSEIESLILDVLYAASDAPAVSDRLLGEFIAPVAAPREPVDIWRGAYRTGMLGRIMASTILPPLVTEQAQRQLQVVLEDRPVVDARSFVAAADLWLEAILPHVVRRTEFDHRAFDSWELWLAAERELGDATGLTGAVLDAIEQLLAAGTDLSRPGPSADVLGRLLQTVDCKDSPQVRQRIVGLFEHPEVSSSDLWVLTSLLAHHDGSAWFGKDLVIDHQADASMRRRVADQIDRRWRVVAQPRSEPVLARGRGINVDGSTLLLWRDLQRALEQEPTSLLPAGVMSQLVAAVRLNTAAVYLMTQVPDDAWSQLDAIETPSIVGAAADAVDTKDPSPPARRTPPRPPVAPEGRGRGQPPPAVTPPTPPGAPQGRQPGRRRPAVPGGASSGRRPGQSIGPDGAWSTDYDEVRRTMEERLDRLRALRSTAGTDLGPDDARTLVREAYRGTPAEIRSVAQAVVVEVFANGPNVTMELLDQFPDAPRNLRISEFIGQVTGELLPSVQSERWSLEARLALVNHALALRPRSQSGTDVAAETVAQLYAEQLTAMRGGGAMGLLTVPEDAAEQLLQEYQRIAATLIAVNAVPDDLTGLNRRHQIRRRLAVGPIQRFVALQLAIAELLTYCTAAEQPAMGPQLRSLLRESAMTRERVGNVLHQALEVERLMSRIWSLRLTGDEPAEDRS